VKPQVIITSRYPDDLVRMLEQHAVVRQGESQAKGMPRDEVLALAPEAVAIINQNELKIDRALLARAPKLKVVANAAAGFDNMDIAAMREQGVIGTNCPLSFAADTANHTIALLLAVTRRLLEADGYVRSGKWRQEGWMPGGRWDGVSLEGKVLGLIGHGHIGRQVAVRATAFGMRVQHHTRSGNGEPGWIDLDTLLATSDVVSLHCPLNEATRHLIDARALGRMKPDAILLNVSRGPVVKNDDLIAALQQGRLRGAGLDVFEFEPEVPEALFAMSNVVLSPHMGGCTVEARQSAWQLCIDNVIAVLSGKAPLTPAFPITSSSQPTART
jgi:glyoxylate reductase